MPKRAREDVAVVSVRLPRNLYITIQKMARLRSLDESKTICGPTIIREAIEREFAVKGNARE